MAVVDARQQRGTVKVGRCTSYLLHPSHSIQQTPARTVYSWKDAAIHSRWPLSMVTKLEWSCNSVIG